MKTSQLAEHLFLINCIQLVLRYYIINSTSHEIHVPWQLDIFCWCSLCCSSFLRFAIYFRLLLLSSHFLPTPAVFSQSAMATGQLPEANLCILIFALKSEPVPSWHIGQKISLHFIQTPQWGEITVFPLEGCWGTCVCVCDVHVCWHTTNLSEICVITIYIYIGSSLSLLFYWSLYLSRAPWLLRSSSKCNPEKSICLNRWSRKWICIQPQTVKWKYLYLLLPHH